MSSVVGTTITVALLVAHVTVGIAVRIPLGIALFFGLRVMQRRQLIARMGPARSAYKGELPVAERKHEIAVDSYTDMSGGFARDEGGYTPALRNFYAARAARGGGARHRGPRNSRPWSM